LCAIIYSRRLWIEFSFAGNYICSDPITNIGHVVAAELESQYPEGSSIKLLVHPVIDCINVYSSGAQENQQGSIDGYGSPVAFTCDSKC
jgi:phosphatidylinositol-4-phosphate 3-kinase